MKFEILSIPFREVRSFAEECAGIPEGIIPITPERAVSQQQNPHADPEETCLWVARGTDGALIGFAGSLPARDARSGGRMGWNTCWWVDPEKGKEAAMPLFYHFLKHWDQKVAFGDMTPQTRAIVDAMGFCHTRKESLLQYYVRIPGRKLVALLGPAGKLLSPLVLPVVFAGNALLQARIRTVMRNRARPAYQCMEHPDDEVYAFIRSHSGQEVAHRDREEFRWIRSHPWLVAPSEKSRDLDRRYPFSCVARDFRMEWLVSREDSEIISVMLVSIRDGVMKVLYFFGPRETAGHALGVLNDYLAWHREVYTLFLSHDHLLMHSARLCPMALRKRMHERRVGISRKLVPDPAAFEQIVFQLGDGDAVFT